MIQETLQEIGLSKNETKIYLALLELGPSLIGKICGKTKIHRRNVYDSIEMLKNKGFISLININNRNIFEAINPKKILNILEEKKQSIEQILPSLLERKNKDQSKIQVYFGKNGKKLIFEDKLNYKKEQYVLNAHKPSKIISNYLENYHLRRIKKKIPLKMLFLNKDIEVAKQFNKYNPIKIKILPKIFTSPIAINIYGNKVAFFLNSESIEPISILIEDQNLTKSFKEHFETLWELSKEL